MAGVDGKVALTGCVAALGTLGVVALFQSGAMQTLPDPPGEIFASERITLSPAAHPMGIPDSYLGLASYGTTLGLLLIANRCPWARRALGLKLMADAGLAGFNVVRQVVSFGKVCSWCTGTALATGMMVYGGREAITDTARGAVAAA